MQLFNIQNIDFIIDFIYIIFNCILFRYFNSNLNDLSIPKSYMDFKKNFENKIDRIKNNYLINASQDLDKILNITYDKDDFDLIDEQGSFFNNFIKIFVLMLNVNEIKNYYEYLIDFRKKIFNFLNFSFISSFILVGVIYLNNNFFIMIMVSIIIYSFLEMFNNYLNFKKMVSKIQNNINIIDKLYEITPLSFGDKYGN